MILSTTEKYDFYENAVAERINGILKYDWVSKNHSMPGMVAQKMIKEAVQVYNNKRRHKSLEMRTQQYAHTKQEHQYKSYRKPVNQTKELLIRF